MWGGPCNVSNIFLFLRRFFKAKKIKMARGDTSFCLFDESFKRALCTDSFFYNL